MAASAYIDKNQVDKALGIMKVRLIKETSVGS